MRCPEHPEWPWKRSSRLTPGPCCDCWPKMPSPHRRPPGPGRSAWALRRRSNSWSPSCTWSAEDHRQRGLRGSGKPRRQPEAREQPHQRSEPHCLAQDRWNPDAGPCPAWCLLQPQSSESWRWPPMGSQQLWCSARIGARAPAPGAAMCRPLGGWERGSVRWTKKPRQRQSHLATSRPIPAPNGPLRAQDLQR